jgi:hypothetical protein
MPNWCNNNLQIRGAKKDVQAFVKLVKSTAVDDRCACIFRALIPMPDELRNTESPARDEELAKQMKDKYGASDWYDWCIQNWGTKWGCCEIDIDEIHKYDDERYIVNISYDTAWAPGDDELRPMFEIWKNLDFFLSYEESGMGFKGYLAVFRGETVGQNCIEMNEIPQDITEVDDGVR